MTEYQTHSALVATLETEIVRLRAINAELRASIQTQVPADTKLVRAARQALEALEEYANFDGPTSTAFDCIIALREALEAVPQPAAQTQDPAAWAITYDGRTPYTLWHEGDGPLLDLEIKRLAGSAQKMALYTTPQPARQPLSDGALRQMWRASTFRGNGGQSDWFIAGFRAAERAHGIGGEA